MDKLKELIEMQKEIIDRQKGIINHLKGEVEALQAEKKKVAHQLQMERRFRESMVGETLTYPWSYETK